MDDNSYWLRFWCCAFVFILFFITILKWDFHGSDTDDTNTTTDIKITFGDEKNNYFYGTYFATPKGYDNKSIVDRENNIIYVVTVFYPTETVKYLANIRFGILTNALRSNALLFWDIENHKMIQIRNVPFKIERHTQLKDTSLPSELVHRLKEETPPTKSYSTESSQQSSSPRSTTNITINN